MEASTYQAMNNIGCGQNESCRKHALDLSTEVRGLTAGPEFIALLLIAGAELLELGERFRREFEHLDRE